MAMWNFQFWVIGIRKKECTAFEPVGERNVRKPELLVNQKTLSTKKKTKTKTNQTKTKKQLKLSYNLHIKKAYVLCATWIS